MTNLSIRIAFIFLLCFNFVVNAQVKHTESVQQVWVAYFNQTRFSDKWGGWADIHLRTKEDFFTNFSQSIVRLGLTYYLTDDAKITAGYAYVNHFPADAHKNISQPEHRTWQQFQWHNKYPRVRVMQWFRLEERWRRKILDDDNLAEGYNFSFRLRYNFFSQFALNKKRFAPKTLSFVVNDEVHVNFGKQIVNNYFDQNRFFLGFNYHINANNNLQFGYMNVFQQLAAGNRYRSTHVARVFYAQSFDLRKKH
ncbi:MAG: DUF2490 domain-containing protein [Chitinophagaceae bacterium]|nr:DUF2490 domain-containing protein [Chitinophagaceae bacterium]